VPQWQPLHQPETKSAHQIKWEVFTVKRKIIDIHDINKVSQLKRRFNRPTQSSNKAITSDDELERAADDPVERR